MSPFRILLAGSALVSLLALGWLGRAERGGPDHFDLTLPNGLPATLYLTGTSAPGRFPPPAGLGKGAPAVLLVHGFTADRAGMSVLARRLAASGYGVLAIDVRGHGANRRPFTQDPEGSGLFADLSDAADWLRGSSWVDGSRLAVVGHSMGAGAVLRFAERDAGVDAAVMISGGWALLGPHRPPNALFVYADGDPERIRASSAALAAQLAGEALAPGATHGDVAARDAVRYLEMPGNDHTTIVWSPAAAREIVRWLDATFAAARDGEPAFADPRLLPAALAGLALPLTLMGVGLAAGALAPAWPRRAGGASGLLPLVAGLAAALPLVGVVPIAAFLGMEVGDALAAILAWAGLLLAGGLALRGVPLLPAEGAGAARSLVAALAAFAAVYALVAPIGVLAHRMVPTPERAAAGLAAAAVLFPFFLAFETLVRRGSPLAAFATGCAGKVVVLAMIAAGVSLGIVPFVVMLLLGGLVLVFALTEIAATALYARSGNLLATAALQAAWLGWTIAALMPMRV
jgi:dienelactone hydrolase